MQFFHFYFFGNPEGLAFNGTCQDMGRSPWLTPSQKLFRPTGAAVFTACQRQPSFDWQEGKIAQVTYQGRQYGN
jgi:isorenieratene synthase